MFTVTKKLPSNDNPLTPGTPSWMEAGATLFRSR
jgi:hypothetical protein